MSHLYDRDPPAFAKDPWAWDYTRDRIEQNSGKTYDEWEPRHFAGASAMYKNVVKKYGPSIQSGTMEPPRECVDCGENKSHYANDFVCQDCRDKIEDASSYYEAEETISRPEAIDDISRMLKEKLGHKDKKPNAAVPVDQATTIVVENSAPANAGKVSRNYSSMNPDKLRRSISELEQGVGEAASKAQAKGEDVMDHLESALRAAQQKGL
jgi:hypothetical protein